LENKMSVIVSTADEINKSPLNTSPSKQLYSFPKTKRFIIPNSKNNPNIAYNLPSTRSRRSASFGYGKRYNFAKNNGSPSPTSYNSTSQFKKIPGAKAFSFGVARGAYSKVYLKGHKAPEMARDVPGPGAYNNELWNSVGKTGKAYTLRPRTGSMGIRVSSKDIPGPGSYEAKSSITSRGTQFLSKFKSSGATTFNPPSSKRFNNNNNK